MATTPQIIQDCSREVIYALLNATGEVFYVGRSWQPDARLEKHKGRFGNNIRMRILQSRYEMETPSQAEYRWISKFVADGCKLENNRGTDGAPIRKRGMVNVRNVPLLMWNYVGERATEMGVNLCQVMEESLMDWLEKTYRADYAPPHKTALHMRAEDIYQKLERATQKSMDDPSLVEDGPQNGQSRGELLLHARESDVA